ncbi:MAG: ACP S-malonyltransferase [Erysipelotrichaceae bacterium]|nr:ACP S-malonyltransferase [Erysipelotrichaceae bacterium]
MSDKKIAFVFAGQGSQKVGMGLDFYNDYESTRLVFDQLDSQIKQACFYGPETELNNTIATQQSLLAFGVAIALVLKQNQINASYCAGLSLGEYTALTYANALSIKDALHVVKARSQIMHDALLNTDSTMMAVINVSLTDVQKVCKEVSLLGVCEVANINSLTQVVISGHSSALERARLLLSSYPKARIVPLTVAGAFHTSLLQDASKQLANVLKTININQPQIPVVFNVNGKSQNDNIAELLTKQIHNTVYFSDSINFMISKGIDTFIEISPKPIIKGLINSIDKNVNCYCVSNIESLNSLLEVLQ